MIIYRFSLVSFMTIIQISHSRYDYMSIFISFFLPNRLIYNLDDFTGKNLLDGPCTKKDPILFDHIGKVLPPDFFFLLFFSYLTE